MNQIFLNLQKLPVSIILQISQFFECFTIYKQIKYKLNQQDLKISSYIDIFNGNSIY